MPAAARRATRPGVEWEFAQHVLPRELSRSVVTRMLTDLAEEGGWELDRVRIAADGVRRVVVRRKIIRQQRQLFFAF